MSDTIGNITGPGPFLPQRPKFELSKGRRLGLKFFLLGALALFLTIPLFMVFALVQDREERFRATTAEIAQQWGGVQQITGPILVVPALIREVSGDAAQTIRQRAGNIIVVPQKLKISAKAKTDTLKRGIYEATVYQSDLVAEGLFSKPDLATLSSDVLSIDWSKAKISMGLSEPNGIESVVVSVAGQLVSSVEPGAFNGAVIMPGFGVTTDAAKGFADSAASFPFKIDLSFKGSQEFNVVALARQTDVDLSSNWPNPSFSGVYLPKSRDISADGFKATWSIPELARNIPAIMVANQDTQYTLSAPVFGVRFYQPVDFYKLVERAVKYGVIFIAAAFLVVFAIELLSGGRMHLVQYTMSGLMIIMFFVLLLAFAEHVGFGMAYAVAAGATGAVISWFVASLFPGKKWSFAAFGSFAVLYGLLYMVLRLEETALLAGAITGFLLLTVLMFSTRKVEWQ